MPAHDPSYKTLFSHPAMVEDLLKGFVRQDWVQELDFTSLEKLNASYVTDDLRERADDLVWRVRFKDQWLYVYLLLEFQSSIDPFMAVRLLTYVGLLYQDLIKTRQLPEPGKLPPVFPVVLYNGGKPWHAATDLSALIQPMPAELAAYQPSLRYVLIDEGRYTEAELEPLHNLVAALFRLENSNQVEQIKRVVGHLVLWLKAPEQHSLNRAFTQWLNRVLLPAKAPGQPIEQIHDLQEMQAMLAERVKDWTREWKEEGLQEGIEKGKAEGKAEGEALVLTKLLTKRFGSLPAWAQDKLNHATTAQLETWAERLFEAESLEQFFA